MKFILGTKGTMTQLFNEETGRMTPVTEVTAGPCFVSQVKTADKNGVPAVQVAFGTKKHINKSQKGHLNGVQATGNVREFRVESDEKANAFTKGDAITCKQFEVGDIVKVQGVSKGKGFQGPVKRHGFSGSLATHGHKDQHRMPGSIGATDPAHVFKGTRMAGRMGGDTVTADRLSIEKIDSDSHTLFIKGALPGFTGSLLLITADGDMTPEKMEDKKSSSMPETSDEQEKKETPSKDSLTEEKVEEKQEPKAEDVKEDSSASEASDEQEKKEDKQETSKEEGK